MKAAGVEPNVISYSVVMSACETGKQWELAREVFDSTHSRENLNLGGLEQGSCLLAFR